MKYASHIDVQLAGFFMIHICLRGFDGMDQDDPQLSAGVGKMLVVFVREQFCLMKQIKPITGFIGFLQRDLQLCDKIRLAVGVLRFPNVCANGKPTASKLVGNDVFLSALQPLRQSENLH